MQNGNGPPGASFDVARFAATLTEWLEDNELLLEGLVALREIGEPADAAVTSVLLVQDVRRISAGWALWEVLAEGEGLDPEVLLFDAAPMRLIELGRMALWGDDAYTAPVSDPDEAPSIS
jgi:hypothetical protein